MRSDQITSERLERQKSLIDTIASRIEERANAGQHVELSRGLLRQEQRLYRRMMGEAPLSVLEEHATSACST